MISKFNRLEWYAAGKFTRHKMISSTGAGATGWKGIRLNTLLGTGRAGEFMGNARLMHKLLGVSRCLEGGLFVRQSILNQRGSKAFHLSSVTFSGYIRPSRPLVVPSDKETLVSFLAHPQVAQQWVTSKVPETPSDLDHLNAPSTFPIDEPVTDPNSEKVSAIKRLYRMGKHCIRIYKSGVKATWQNRKRAKSIKQRIGIRDTDQIAKIILEQHAYELASTIGPLSEHINKEEAGQGEKIPVVVTTPANDDLNRAEYSILRRSPKDTLKLPLFGLIFAAFFEMTPLIVFLVPGITPATCALPWQRLSELRKLDKFATNGRAKFATVDRSATAEHLSRDQLCAFLKATRNIGSYGFYSFFAPSFILRKLVWHHLRHIRADNKLIGDWGGVWRMSSNELNRALAERARPTCGKDIKDKRIELFLWISQFETSGSDAGFFMNSDFKIDKNLIAKIQNLRDSVPLEIQDVKERPCLLPKN